MVFYPIHLPRLLHARPSSHIPSRGTHAPTHIKLTLWCGRNLNCHDALPLHVLHILDCQKCRDCLGGVQGCWQLNRHATHCAATQPPDLTHTREAAQVGWAGGICGADGAGDMRHWQRHQPGLDGEMVETRVGSG